MRIVIAPDSFKESMDAVTAADAMAAGVHDVLPHADCVAVPLADGGEGTCRALTTAMDGWLEAVSCTDALAREVTGQIGLVNGQNTITAVIEAASSNGLDLIAPSERDATAATTRGVADLVLAALDAGARSLIVGLGGSATTDAGAGLLVGLGAQFFDADDRDVPPLPRELYRVASVDLSGLDPRLASTEITVASDVTSPLTGTGGAATVFGPQKGASPQDVEVLDAALSTVADAVENAAGTALASEPGTALRDTPGAGAAGGLGFAFLALGAALRPGIEVVTEATGLHDHLADADLILTAEGSVDSQTATGKVPAGVARLASDAGVPTIVFAGRVEPGAEALYDLGVRALVPIVPGPQSLAQALEDGPANLRRATATAMRLCRLSSTFK